MRRPRPPTSVAASDTRPSTAASNQSVGNRRRGGNSSAGTRTSSSGDHDTLSDTDEVEDRHCFVQEYDRLAKTHGIRPLSLGNPRWTPADHAPSRHKRGWFSRSILRHASASDDDSGARSGDRVQRKCSVSELASRLVKARKDGLSDEDLQSLVRLCGKSTLDLPSEYAAGPLVLPTCLRATSQYLACHGTGSGGLFRIPGSVRVVGALYDYYCAEQDADRTASTIRCPSLPRHIKAGIHDVASTFKKFLAGLPGGILGSLSLFDSLVATHYRVSGNVWTASTEGSCTRARLTALAIGTVPSRFRRESICAVFGLLSLIGRAAEQCPAAGNKENSDLMGYGALGIVFGPLLLGDLLSSYTLKAAADHEPGSALPLSTPPRPRKDRRKNRSSEDSATASPDIDRIHIANGVAEMLISNWREIVTHMKMLRVLRTGTDFTVLPPPQRRDRWLRPIASEPSVLDKSSGAGSHSDLRVPHEAHEPLHLSRRRSQSCRPAFRDGLPGRLSLSFLSPTAEESTVDISTSISQRGRDKVKNPHRTTIIEGSRGLETRARQASIASGIEYSLAAIPQNDVRRRLHRETTEAIGSQPPSARDGRAATHTVKDNPTRGRCHMAREDPSGMSADCKAGGVFRSGDDPGAGQKLSHPRSRSSSGRLRGRQATTKESPRSVRQMSPLDDGSLKAEPRSEWLLDGRPVSEASKRRPRTLAVNTLARGHDPTGAGATSGESGGVRAMAALFERASKDSNPPPPPMRDTRRPGRDVRPGNTIPQSANNDSSVSLGSTMTDSLQSAKASHTRQKETGSEGPGSVSAAEATQQNRHGRQVGGPQIIAATRQPATHGYKEASRYAADSPGPGTASNSIILHSRLRELEKQLEAKALEVARLQQELQTRWDTDKIALYGQLRAEQTECQMWRERATAAESRMASLGRATTSDVELRRRPETRVCAGSPTSPAPGAHTQRPNSAEAKGHGRLGREPPEPRRRDWPSPALTGGDSLLPAGGDDFPPEEVWRSFQAVYAAEIADGDAGAQPATPHGTEEETAVQTANGTTGDALGRDGRGQSIRPTPRPRARLI